VKKISTRVEWIHILLLLFVISLMQGIYSYVPETNHASRVYSVAAVQYSQFVLHVMLFTMLNVLCFDISTFRSMRAVPNMAAVIT
jgi:hypothetical protein